MVADDDSDWQEIMDDNPIFDFNSIPLPLFHKGFVLELPAEHQRVSDQPIPEEDKSYDLADLRDGILGVGPLADAYRRNPEKYALDLVDLLEQLEEEMT